MAGSGTREGLDFWGETLASVACYKEPGRGRKVNGRMESKGVSRKVFKGADHGYLL